MSAKVPLNSPAQIAQSRIAGMLAADTHPLVTPRVRRYLTGSAGFDDAAWRAWQMQWFGTGLAAVEQRLASEQQRAERQLRLAWQASLGLTLLSTLAVMAMLGYYYSRRVLRPLSAMNEQVLAMKAGLAFEPLDCMQEQSEVGELARSLALYSATREQVAQEQWAKSHQARIATLLQACSSFSELAQRFLSEVCPLLQVGHGVFYVLDAEHHRLRLIAQYAHSERKGLAQRFDLGESLVGQCALEKAPIQITRPPADYVRISSSLGEAPPEAILALPVLSGGKVLAVIELAALRLFGPREEGLLEGLLPMRQIGVVAHIAPRHAVDERHANGHDGHGDQQFQQGEASHALSRGA